jgi:hypothetical protein
VDQTGPLTINSPTRLPAPALAVAIVQVVSTVARLNLPNTSRAPGVSLIDRMNRPAMPEHLEAA